MASIKKKGGGGGGGANWMDTYGDMVTLLLCFFVLLYSISTIEQDKWMVFVKSFNRDAIDEMSPVTPGPIDGDDGSGGSDLPIPDDNNEIDQALKELYDFLVENVQSSEGADSSSEITVSDGDGYVFISFAESVFFGPDSSKLRQEGKDVLDKLIPSLRACAPAIDELRVMGHTSQARENEHNRPAFDRQLASLRATNVAVYIQENTNDVLDPGRLVTIGYGEWRPTVPNDSEENRVRNRRVEMIITGKDLESDMAGEYEKYETNFTSTGSIDVPD